ncbi:hypothetical protein ACFVH0_08015 [Streptomyces sp. NPDC127117]|uniref:hypothetical protein n=1 Tax=Streptomyces sp. NPDC127117 TaxID=3345368 RepID=UPI0036357234
MLLHLDATSMPDDLRLRTRRVVIELLEEDPHPAVEVPVPADGRIRAPADDVMRDPESEFSWTRRYEALPAAVRSELDTMWDNPADEPEDLATRYEDRLGKLGP